VNVHFSSKTHEWVTPDDFFSRLNAIYAFDLDPRATAENTKCERIFAKAQSGLAQSRRGCRVFMNPPYGSEDGAWVEKAAAFAKAPHGVQFNLLKYLTGLSSLKSAR
jgi:phage N-6-adenine-methyltransferase